MTVKLTIRKSLFAAAMVMGSYLPSFAYSGVWHNVPAENVPASGIRYLNPDKFMVYRMDLQSLKPLLNATGTQPVDAVIIELPMPDGALRAFKVWQSNTMAPELAAKYPEIKTFNAMATDNSGATAKLDYTVFGFHAMIFDGKQTIFIDPYSNVDDGFYLCYYKHDYTKRPAGFVPCSVTGGPITEPGTGRALVGNDNPVSQNLVHGVVKRTYRLALACTQEYANVVTGGNPTKPGVLSAMVTSMNRVNGVYEKELSLTMELIANNDQLIYLAEPDPYASGSQSENQINVNNTIGAANYDIGHLFRKTNGGVSDLGCVCNDNRKARSVTGQPNPVGDPFDIDYVAHEMGHQFGAEHTFNASSGSCAGNGVSYVAYEPGSGSTVMAYAGICNEAGKDNNIVNHSSDYFHAASLEQITEFITLNNGSTCGTAVPSNNTPAVVPPFAFDRDIPKGTPFELTAPEAVDADHQSLTYCWEEWDLDQFGADFWATSTGPVFRSFNPVAGRTRVFPTIEKIIANTNNYLGEKLPDVARDMKFKLTVRDVNNGFGAINFPDDEVVLHVTDAAGPFLVMGPNTATDYWQMGTQQTVTWDVANTTAAPVNCQNVDITLSLDGGRTYTETLATGVPNSGSAVITVPNTPTASARVKVKGENNVFFDISNHDFKINSWTASVDDFTTQANISVYPVPATDMLHVDVKGNDQYTLTVYNAVGQLIWTTNAGKQNAVDVKPWAKGVYQLQMLKSQTGQRTVKTIQVQ